MESRFLSMWFSFFAGRRLTCLFSLPVLRESRAHSPAAQTQSTWQRSGMRMKLCMLPDRAANLRLALSVP